MDQGGDHSKKVIIGVSLEYLGGSGPPAVAVDALIPITSIWKHSTPLHQGLPSGNIWKMRAI